MPLTSDFLSVGALSGPRVRHVPPELHIFNTLHFCKEVGFRINLEPSTVSLIPEIIGELSERIPLQRTSFSLTPIDSTEYYTVQGGWNEQHFEDYI